jgi:hypothetical protein
MTENAYQTMAGHWQGLTLADDDNSMQCGENNFPVLSIVKMANRLLYVTQS